MVIALSVMLAVAMFTAGFFVGRAKAYKDGYDKGFKSGNAGGFTEDEKDSIKQVLAVLTYGAEKKDED